LKKLLLFALLASLLPLPASAAPHSNTLTLVQGGSTITAPQQCTNTQTCTMQLYNMKGCTSSTTVGSGTWTALTTTQLASSSTTTGSSWTYVDNTVSGQVTCYYATVTFTSGGSASLPTSVLFLTTPTDPPAAGVLTGVAN
jgi:hypothetical protein